MRDTEVFNHVVRAKDDLKRRLAEENPAMTQYAFGSGTLVCKRTDVTGTPPCLIGTLQDVCLTSIARSRRCWANTTWR